MVFFMATFSGDVQYTQVMGHLPTPGNFHGEHLIIRCQNSKDLPKIGSHDSPQQKSSHFMDQATEIPIKQKKQLPSGNLT